MYDILTLWMILYQYWIWRVCSFPFFQQLLQMVATSMNCLGAPWDVLSCCCSFWLLCSMGKHGRFYLQTMSSCVYHIRTNQSTTFPWSTARVHHTARILDWHYHCTTLVYMLFTFCFLHFTKNYQGLTSHLVHRKQVSWLKETLRKFCPCLFVVVPQHASSLNFRIVSWPRKLISGKHKH